MQIVKSWLYVSVQSCRGIWALNHPWFNSSGFSLEFFPKFLDSWLNPGYWSSKSLIKAYPAKRKTFEDKCSPGIRFLKGISKDSLTNEHADLRLCNTILPYACRQTSKERGKTLCSYFKLNHSYYHFCAIITKLITGFIS